MKNIINKISRALQVVLLAPIKLPGKALTILKYVAVGLGIIESVLDNGKPESETLGRARTDSDPTDGALAVGEENGDRAEMRAEDNHLIGKEERDE